MKMFFTLQQQAQAAVLQLTTVGLALELLSDRRKQ